MTEYFSATAISSFDECARKWAWRYVEGLQTPPHPAALLGTEVDDEQLQPYLRGERSGFDYSRESGSGEIAASMLSYLPPPKSVEIQHYFQLPSPTWHTVNGTRQHAGFGFHGYTDFWAKDRRVFPDLPEPTHVYGTPVPCDVIPAVGDSKTTSDIGRWAKSEKKLSTDRQAMLYATALMYETGAKAADLIWIYGQTRGARKSKRVHLRVYADHVAKQFSAINDTALEMVDTRRRLLADENGSPLQLPPNLDTCSMYGGCPYQDRCNLGPGQIAEALAAKDKALRAAKPLETKGPPTMNPTLALLNGLKAKAAAAQGATAPTPAAVAPPAPPAPAPAGLPAWATAPVDPLKAAHAAGQHYTSSAAGQHPTGPINPPESALPPPAPAPLAVAPPPAAEPAKRGRPKKEEATAAPATSAGSSTTIRVVFGQETFTPVPYNSFTVGPFEATITVGPGEDPIAAASEAYAKLAAFAESTRLEKATAFAAMLGGAK